jgi:hypothetical protein
MPANRGTHERPSTRVITVRRSTVVRLGIAALLVVAVGIGFGIGYTVRPELNSSAISTHNGSSTTTTRTSTTTSSVSTTTVAPVPAVLSCGPASTRHVRPATITVGCPSGQVNVTAITWNTWDAAAGGQGTGTMNVYLTSVPVIVVVFDDVNGVFQAVSITPTQGVSSTATLPSASSTSTTFSVTTTTTGGPSPIAASGPGTGWGGQ